MEKKREFIKLKIEDHVKPEILSQYKEVLQSNIHLDDAIKNGCWIAGGFARNMFLNKDIHKYLEGFCETKPYINSGDIDVYFPSKELKDHTLAKMKSANSGYKSNFSWNVMQHSKTKEKRYGVTLNYCYRIQFIEYENLLYEGGVEQCISDFDIVNCSVAIDKEFIYFDKRNIELEKERKLLVNRSDMPLLGNRVMKYTTMRGLDSLHEDSYELIKEWIFNCIYNKFPLFNKFIRPFRMEIFGKLSNKMSSYGTDSAQSILNTSLLPVKQRIYLLALFVSSRWIEKQTSYGQTVVVDWASNLISELKKKEENNDQAVA